MNLFQIECFLALSRSLNFTQTSEAMYITLEDVESFKRWLLWDQDSQNPALPMFLACAKTFVNREI